MANWENKTLFVGDNLHVLRGMDSQTVDLIYLDPPFNSNRSYAAPIGSKAAGAAFKDAWTLSDIDLVEHQALKQDHPSLYAVIDAAGTAHSKGMKSYLLMMAMRLVEMRRVLKETGSLYLHCDPTASHYLKLTLDAIFGRSNFRNEIAWKRTSSRSDAKGFGRIHDVILLYNKGDAFTWNPIYQDYDPEYVKRFYRYDDGDGRGCWQSDNLTGPGIRYGESGQPWRDINPTESGRSWSVPFKGEMARWINDNIIPGYLSMQSIQDRLDALDAAGMIHWPKGGNIPRLKRYLTSTQGSAVCDMITDISPLAASSKEKVGYPTQKPLALLDRILSASSNEGDIVLDPFCGCATTLVAADRLDRQWIGVDLSAKAGDLVQERIEADQGHLFKDIQVRSDVPKRTDLGPPLTAQEKREYKRILYGLQVGRCNGCNVHFERLEDFHMDHIVARARGGTDHKWNFQLLCGHCNSVKGKKTQAEFAAIISQKRKDFSWM